MSNDHPHHLLFFAQGLSLTAGAYFGIVQHTGHARSNALLPPEQPSDDDYWKVVCKYTSFLATQVRLPCMHVYTGFHSSPGGLSSVTYSVAD